MKWTPRTVLAGALVLVALGIAGGMLSWLSLRSRVAVQTDERRPLPTERVRGDQIDAALLARGMPPPPADALAYEIRAPLRNGRTVPVKNRWMWVPNGQRLRFLQEAGGRFAVEVPVGTKLWKDFHLGTDSGPALIERRLVVKVADDDRKNGVLANGGWLLYTGHHLPASADGMQGFDSQVELPLDRAGPFFFNESAWLPIQEKSAATFVNFVGTDGKRHPYVFTGKTNCLYCHEGSAGAFAQSERSPVLAFGLHPTNLTAASIRSLVDRGWVDVEPAVLERIMKEVSVAPGDPTHALSEVLRNNCASCHNDAPRAPGRATALVLEPARLYERAELASAMSQRARFMGPEGRPLVVPGRPEESEIVMRLEGRHGRRRMPPAEGGVPEADLELSARVKGWIAQLPSER